MDLNEVCFVVIIRVVVILNYEQQLNCKMVPIWVPKTVFHVGG